MAFCTVRRRSRAGRQGCGRKTRWQRSADPSPTSLPAPDRSSPSHDPAPFVGGRFATSEASRADFQQSEQEQAPGSASGHDVVDERIDVSAQFAILRMRGRGGADGTAAGEALRRVKSGELGGIFGDDLGIAAKYGTRLGKPRWELTGGRPAARVGPVDGLPEAVFFREHLRQDRDAMDEVIRFVAGRSGARPVCARIRGLEPS